MPQTCPPIAMVFWRWVIAGCILFPLCIKPFVRDLHIIRANLPYIALQGFLSITAFNALLYWGLHYTTVVNTSLVQASMPVITLFFSWIILRRGLNPLGIIGIFVSLTGVAWVVLRGDFATLSTLSFNPGDMLILVAITLWSIYTVLLAKAPVNLSRMAFTFSAVLSGLVFFSPFMDGNCPQGCHFISTATLFLPLSISVFSHSVLSFYAGTRGLNLSVLQQPEHSLI